MPLSVCAWLRAALHEAPCIHTIHTHAAVRRACHRHAHTAAVTHVEANSLLPIGSIWAPSPTSACVVYAALRWRACFAVHLYALQRVVHGVGRVRAHAGGTRSLGDLRDAERGRRHAGVGLLGPHAAVSGHGGVCTGVHGHGQPAR